jgi:hypothetical protein
MALQISEIAASSKFLSSGRSSFQEKTRADVAKVSKKLQQKSADT